MKKLVSVLLALVLALGVCGAFAESAALPAYTYHGDDPVWTAVVKYMQENDFGFEAPEGGILVPTPIILRTDVAADETGEPAEATVYGNVWIFTYALEGQILKNVSGGETPGVLKLEKKDGAWNVISLKVAEDGENFADSIRAFANGDEELEKEYFLSCDATDGYPPQYRCSFILEYVNANHLDITAYQDYGWEPVDITM